MSSGSLNNTKLKTEIRQFFNKNKEVLLDIIIFGSLIRGKEKPNDIDILVLHKDKKNISLSHQLKKILRTDGFNVEIIDKTYAELFQESFKARESILSEGKSVVYGASISENLGYMPFVLFRYELKGFNNSDRMRFYYSLNGRGKDQDGIVGELDAIKFSDGVLFCPIQSSEKMKEFMEHWKIKYTDFQILLPSRLKSILR